MRLTEEDISDTLQACEETRPGLPSWDSGYVGELARDLLDARASITAVRALPEWFTANGMDPQTAAFIKANIDAAVGDA